MKRLLAVSLLLIASSAFSSPAFAQCQSKFANHLNWARNLRLVGFKLTSNRADGTYVSYTEGSLKAKLDGPNVVGLTSSQRALQLFSDRKYSFENLSRCTFLQSNRAVPFSIFAPDQLDLEVLPANSGANVTVNMTLLSWGSGRQTFVGTCQNDVIFGFVPSTQSIFTLSLVNLNP